MMHVIGGVMILSFIEKILEPILSTFNQLIPKDKAKVKETPMHREHPWEGKRKKKRGQLRDAARDKQHNTNPLGAPHAETKIFNHPRH